MVRHASLFSQLVPIFNRNQFHRLVFRRKAERFRKGHSSWNHFRSHVDFHLVKLEHFGEGRCGELGRPGRAARDMDQIYDVLDEADKQRTMALLEACRPGQAIDQIEFPFVDQTLTNLSK